MRYAYTYLRFYINLLYCLNIFTDKIQYTLDNNNVSNLNNNNMELIQYIDFTSLCEDYNLETGDITPMQQFEIENVLKQFIKQNK